MRQFAFILSVLLTWTRPIRAPLIILIKETALIHLISQMAAVLFLLAESTTTVRRKCTFILCVEVKSRFGYTQIPISRSENGKIREMVLFLGTIIVDKHVPTGTK